MSTLVRVSMAAGLLLANVACSSLMAEDPRFTGDITRNTVAALPQEATLDVSQDAPQAAGQVAALDVAGDTPSASARLSIDRDGVIEEVLDVGGDPGLTVSRPARTRAMATPGAPDLRAPGQYPDYLASMNRVLDRQNDSARRAVRSMCGGC
jgi:hypothetical protein